MKLKFIKENDDVKVRILDKEEDIDFDYIKMINILYNEKTIAPAIFEGEFSKEETEKINSFIEEMLEKIVSSSQSEEKA